MLGNAVPQEGSVLSAFWSLEPGCPVPSPTWVIHPCLGLAGYYKLESAREQFPEFSQGLQRSLTWGRENWALSTALQKQEQLWAEVTYYKVPFPVPVNGLVSDRGLGNRLWTGLSSEAAP